MSELIKCEDLENWLRTECYGTDTDEDKEYVIERLRNELHTASPWHRVEEPPKLYELVPNEFYVSTMLVMFWHGCYYVGYALSDKKNGPVRWVKDGLTISPTHWMPIEPPKENANADK